LEPVAFGDAALSAVNEFHPDIVLMDIEQAGVSEGIQAEEVIRSLTGTPVIFLTPYSHVPMLRQAQSAALY
jgi:CheY-like chemotaxis protein